MGRKKIRIERIPDERNRQVTFTKRKNGLLKKARELSILCEAEIAVIIFSTAGGQTRLHDYCSNNLSSTLTKLANYEGAVESRDNITYNSPVTPERQALTPSGPDDRRAPIARAAGAAAIAISRRTPTGPPISNQINHITASNNNMNMNNNHEDDDDDDDDDSDKDSGGDQDRKSNSQHQQQSTNYHIRTSNTPWSNSRITQHQQITNQHPPPHPNTQIRQQPQSQQHQQHQQHQQSQQQTNPISHHRPPQPSPLTRTNNLPLSSQTPYSSLSSNPLSNPPTPSRNSNFLPTHLMSPRALPSPRDVLGSPGTALLSPKAPLISPRAGLPSPRDALNLPHLGRPTNVSFPPSRTSIPSTINTTNNNTAIKKEEPILSVHSNKSQLNDPARRPRIDSNHNDHPKTSAAELKGKFKRELKVLIPQSTNLPFSTTPNAIGRSSGLVGSALPSGSGPGLSPASRWANWHGPSSTPLSTTRNTSNTLAPMNGRATPGAQPGPEVFTSFSGTPMQNEYPVDPLATPKAIQNPPTAYQPLPSPTQTGLLPLNNRFLPAPTPTSSSGQHIGIAGLPINTSGSSTTLGKRFSPDRLGPIEPVQGPPSARPRLGESH